VLNPLICNYFAIKRVKKNLETSQTPFDSACNNPRLRNFFSHNLLQHVLVQREMGHQASQLACLLISRAAQAIPPMPVSVQFETA
jgi:hypothetical protein